MLRERAEARRNEMMLSSAVFDFGEENEPREENRGALSVEPDFAVEVRSMLFCVPITALARHEKIKGIK